MSDSSSELRSPQRIASYFIQEKSALIIITISGLLYNIGLISGPLFEGQLAQRLYEIIQGRERWQAMVSLASIYVAVTLMVQAARYLKRFYVRRFANNINRKMKHVLYNVILHKPGEELSQESTGSMMTRAVADVDACAEGMRKFTTEVFDTGVVMIAYCSMLIYYDWRLTLISCIFPPIAFWLAAAMKKSVSRCAAAQKESAGRLNEATLERVSNAVTYRVFGLEHARDEAYEIHLADYEKKAVASILRENAVQPLYQIVSLISMVFILLIGGRNVAGTGWTTWNIAAFTTYLACFSKLSLKASKAAKLFNSVQKAQVSWKRIQPLLLEIAPGEDVTIASPAELTVDGLSFAYPGKPPVFQSVSFTVHPGQIIGVTGPVVCGKSTLGRTFLCERPYGGSIRFGGEELRDLTPEERSGILGYLGHQPELLSVSISENILLGSPGDGMDYLEAVCLDREVAAMPHGADTLVGSDGVRLSGGQQSRLALARTLFHKRPLLILDDPFAAVDLPTERRIMANLRRLTADCTVILLSHRLSLFPQLDQVLWMEDGRVVASAHQELMSENPTYANLYYAQSDSVHIEGGESHE